MVGNVTKILEKTIYEGNIIGNTLIKYHVMVDKRKI
jgi:hypothetical protein